MIKFEHTVSPFFAEYIPLLSETFNIELEPKHFNFLLVLYTQLIRDFDSMKEIDEEINVFGWYREFLDIYKNEIIDTLKFHKAIPSKEIVSIFESLASVEGVKVNDTFELNEPLSDEPSDETLIIHYLTSIDQITQAKFLSFYKDRKIISNPIPYAVSAILSTSKTIKTASKYSSRVRMQRALKAQKTFTTDIRDSWRELQRKTAVNPIYYEVVNAYSLACHEVNLANKKYIKDGNNKRKSKGKKEPIKMVELIGFPKYRFFELCNNGETPTKKQKEMINRVLRNLSSLRDKDDNHLTDLLRNYPDKSGRLITIHPSEMFSIFKGHTIAYIDRLHKACVDQSPTCRALTYAFSMYLLMKQKKTQRMTTKQIQVIFPDIKDRYIEQNLKNVIKAFRLAGLWKVKTETGKEKTYIFTRIVANTTSQPHKLL